MARTLFEVRTEMVEAFERGAWDEALRRCIVILQGAPGNFEARMKVADILLKQGMVDEAQEVYKVVAWHFTKAGFPLLGIVAIKMLTSFEASYQAVLDVLASLYAAGSDRVSPDAPRPQLPRLESVEITEAALNVDRVVPLAGAELGALAARLAKDERGLGAYPDELPALPLFSDLPEDAFARLLADLKLRRFARDGVVIREGEPGDSFFLLARGVVEVSKKVGGERLKLTELRDGAVFGEMALVSHEPRTATVRARTHLDLLELHRGDLEKEAGDYESVSRALARFTRSRMLNNLMAISAVFRGLPPAERHAMLERFISTEVRKGQVIIEEGSRGIGLFVILRGDAEVKKREGDTLVPVALLREGDLFGEISLIKDVPTTATVIAGRDGEFLFLSRKEFETRIRRSPELWRSLSRISDDRLKETARLVAETDFLGDDEFVLL